ncbi:hypothetical protein VULLAG_LOCUS13377 [Vulpes lagopus]
MIPLFERCGRSQAFDCFLALVCSKSRRSTSMMLNHPLHVFDRLDMIWRDPELYRRQGALDSCNPYPQLNLTVLCLNDYPRASYFLSEPRFSLLKSLMHI